MIFMHNYYAQPLYYTHVSKLCESLTDWSIPLKAQKEFEFFIIGSNSFHMCAPFTAMEFLNKLVYCFRDIQVPSFFWPGCSGWDVWDQCEQRTHIVCNPFTALYTNCDCLYLVRSNEIR